MNCVNLFKLIPSKTLFHFKPVAVCINTHSSINRLTKYKSVSVAVEYVILEIVRQVAYKYFMVFYSINTNDLYFDVNVYQFYLFNF